MESSLIKKIAVTFEVTGSTLSEAAIEIVITQLSAYPEHAVSLALDKCMAEVKGRLTPAHIIERIDDGRPGVEEAWNLLPKTEAETSVMTREMMTAFGACCDLMDIGDMVGARMAFKEKYTSLLSDSRAHNDPIEWVPSLGHDKSGRECVIREAVKCGKLPVKNAIAMLPESDFSKDVAQIEARNAEAEQKLEGIVSGVLTDGQIDS